MTVHTFAKWEATEATQHECADGTENRPNFLANPILRDAHFIDEEVVGGGGDPFKASQGYVGEPDWNPGSSYCSTDVCEQRR